jgi:hypothetical protein
MPRVCTICSHESRAAIDAAAIAGASNRVIARQFHVGHDAVLRHKAEHLLAEMVKARQAEDVTKATDLLAIATERDAKAWAWALSAEAHGDRKTAGQMLRISLVSLELLAKLRGLLNEHATVNILLVPEYVETRTAIMRALEPYTEARHAVVAALAQLVAAQAGQRQDQDGAVEAGDGHGYQLSS